MGMYTHRYTYYFNVNLGNSTNICVVHLCSMYISYVGKYLGSNTRGLTCSILDFFDPVPGIQYTLFQYLWMDF